MSVAYKLPDKVHQYEGAKLCRDLAFRSKHFDKECLEPLDQAYQIFKAYLARATNKNQVEYARSNKNAISEPVLVEARQYCNTSRLG